MRRIEGAPRTLVYAQLAAAACTVLEIILPLMLWQGVAYRPERDPVVTQALNDVAWLTFIDTTTVLIQNAIIGAILLQDRNSVGRGLEPRPPTSEVYDLG